MQKSIQDIYTQYNLMKNLQEHQLRVAAVGLMVAENITKKVDREVIVQACLLHDMGNIIKFKLELFPQFLEPQGLVYWTKVQEEFKNRYGKNEHLAHAKIARELAVSKRIIHIIENLSFDYLPRHIQEDDWEMKICQYADLRVGPLGILSLQERLAEGARRYQITPESENWESIQAAPLLEEQIFHVATMLPDEIDDQAISPFYARVMDWNITLP